MAQTLSAMHFVFGSATAPSAALALLNETLCANIIRGMFVTTLVGKMDPATRMVELASAGHCLPLLVKAGGAAAKIETPGSLPLGILPKVSYSDGVVELDLGDRLVVYTDGLSESRQEGSDMLFDEVLTSAASGPSPSTSELLDRILQAERKHRGAGLQLDDLTILVGGFE